MARPGAIPLASQEYDMINEQNMRNAVEQEIQDLSTEVVRNENKKTKDGTLALRRFQFLTMGSGKSLSNLPPDAHNFLRLQRASAIKSLL